MSTEGTIGSTARSVALKMVAECQDINRKRLMYHALQHDSEPQDVINALHRLMDTPAPIRAKRLSVSDRHRRLHYIMSEFLELVKASGFQLQAPDSSTGYDSTQPLTKSNLRIEHIEGSQQDTIGMMDGLADMIVVELGMVVEMGQHMPGVFTEVVAGSITKLNPETGRIDTNKCTLAKADCHAQFIGTECHEPSHLILPDEPVGKWIKGRNYHAPNLTGLVTIPEGND